MSARNYESSNKFKIDSNFDKNRLQYNFYIKTATSIFKNSPKHVLLGPPQLYRWFDTLYFPEMRILHDFQT